MVFVISVRGFSVLLCFFLSGFMWSSCGVLGICGLFPCLKFHNIHKAPFFL